MRLGMCLLLLFSGLKKPVSVSVFPLRSHEGNRGIWISKSKHKAGLETCQAVMYSTTVLHLLGQCYAFSCCHICSCTLLLCMLYLRPVGLKFICHNPLN